MSYEVLRIFVSSKNGRTQWVVAESVSYDNSLQQLERECHLSSSSTRVGLVSRNIEICLNVEKAIRWSVTGMDKSGTWIDFYRFLTWPLSYCKDLSPGNFCSVGVFDMKHYLQLNLRLRVSKNLSSLNVQCPTLSRFIFVEMSVRSSSQHLSGNFPLIFGRPRRQSSVCFNRDNTTAV